MRNHKIILVLVTALIASVNVYSQNNTASKLDTTNEDSTVWDNYSKLFWEVNAYNNLKRFGFGTTVAYAPARFGGYVSYKLDSEFDYFSLGAIYRPLTMKRLDLQLFAGPMLRLDNNKNASLSPEIGFRLSPNKVGNAGWFGWWSISASYAYYGKKQSFYMIGASVSFSSIMALWIMAIERLRF